MSGEEEQFLLRGLFSHSFGSWLPSNRCQSYFKLKHQQHRQGQYENNTALLQTISIDKKKYPLEPRVNLQWQLHDFQWRLLRLLCLEMNCHLIL